MAIYRKGQASMDAQGYITGYDTKWREQLTLIRPGATIVFLTQPLQLAVITEVINDTSIRAISTDGAVVSRSNYAILLHDSITVDGLAQDVAETLRYYQGKESEIAEALEFLKTFDWKHYQDLAKQVEANATSASQSKDAAARSASDALNSKNAAKTSETNAKTSENAANDSKNAAKTSETNAKASETAANSSKMAAANSASAALTYQNAAKTSETNAKNSENAANTSKNSAKSSQDAALASQNAAKASETNAKSSENAANTSKSEAARSASDALASKNAAKASEDKAKEYADSINPANMLNKNNNLSDVANINTARSNMKINRVDQKDASTHIFSQNMRYSLVIDDGGRWGGYDSSDKTYVPLGITEGGTGARTAEDVRNNIGLGTGGRPKFANLSIESRDYPGLALLNNTLPESETGHRVTIETDGSSKTLRIYYRNRESNDGQATVVLPKPGSGVTRNIAFSEEVNVPGKSGWQILNPTSARTATNATNLETGLYWATMNQVGSPISANSGGSLLQLTGNVQGYRCQIVTTDNAGGRAFLRATVNNAHQNYREFTLTAVSDERLKNVIGDLNVEGSLDNINRMNFKIFKFNDDSSDKSYRRGVISQQIRTIDKEYTKEIGGFYHLDQTPMLLDGLAAIKALRARDVDNKERIAKLENEVAELKDLLSKLINNPTTLN